MATCPIKNGVQNRNKGMGSLLITCSLQLSFIYDQPLDLKIGAKLANFWKNK